jgi:hypothetical protein
MEYWWNDTDRGKAKCLEKNLPQYHIVYHKSQMDWQGIEPPAPWHGLLKTTVNLSYMSIE